MLHYVVLCGNIPYFIVTLDILSCPQYDARFEIILEIFDYHFQMHSIRTLAIHGIVLLLFSLCDKGHRFLIINFIKS